MKILPHFLLAHVDDLKNAAVDRLLLPDIVDILRSMVSPLILHQDLVIILHHEIVSAEVIFYFVFVGSIEAVKRLHHGGHDVQIELTNRRFVQYLQDAKTCVHLDCRRFKLEDYFEKTVLLLSAFGE